MNALAYLRTPLCSPVDSHNARSSETSCTASRFFGESGSVNEEAMDAALPGLGAVSLMMFSDMEENNV